MTVKRTLKRTLMLAIVLLGVASFIGPTWSMAEFSDEHTGTSILSTKDNSANSIRYDENGAAGPGPFPYSGVRFSITNTGEDNVTLTGIGIDSKFGKAEYVYERFSDVSMREVHMYDAENHNQRGYLETGDGNYTEGKEYVLGSGVVNLTKPTEIAENEKIYILSYYFHDDKNERIGMEKKKVSFTLEFSDGSTREITFKADS